MLGLPVLLMYPLLLPKRTHPNIESDEEVVVVVVSLVIESIFIVGSRGAGRVESNVLAVSTGAVAICAVMADKTGDEVLAALLLLEVVELLEPRVPETINKNTS